MMIIAIQVKKETWVIPQQNAKFSRILETRGYFSITVLLYSPKFDRVVLELTNVLFIQINEMFWEFEILLQNICYTNINMMENLLEKSSEIQ